VAGNHHPERHVLLLTRQRPRQLLVRDQGGHYDSHGLLSVVTAVPE
jgi:hypothetical protein